MASLRVSDRLLCLLCVFWVLSRKPSTENHGPWGGGGEARDTCSQVPVCSPFLPAVSYQQGILSATIFYAILLGKATLYAMLVGALVLMAKVRRRAGWDSGGDT